MPSEPARIPTRRKTSASGTPSRDEARLEATPSASKPPTAARTSAVAVGSAATIIGAASSLWLQSSIELFDRRDGWLACLLETRGNLLVLLEHTQNIAVRELLEI